MASNNTAAPYPEAFNFSKPEGWPQWIKRFDRFLELNQIDKEERQVSSLVYAEDILQTFGLDADAKKYSVVRDRFEKHYVVRRNVIF